MAGDTYLTAASDKTSAYGKWIHRVKDIKGGYTYAFTVEYFPENVACESKCIFAMLTWTDINGSLLTRDYADNDCVLPEWLETFEI